jgi:poly(hydroxyalkanoate) depolymerase family esterase
MTKLRLSICLAALAVAGLAPAAHATARPAPAAGSFTEHTFAATGTTPARNYWLYLPPGAAHRPRPLVVFLHGCNETALQTAQATHFNALAAEKHFVVVYPEQNADPMSSEPIGDGNGIGCWNWFLPQDQSRDSGEPGTLAGITRSVASTASIDPRRVYVEGISAGGAMADILAATYPDLYAAAASLTGCAYATCSDVDGSQTVAAMGPRARVVPMFVETGTADTINPVPQSQGVVTSWLGVADLLDDGSHNGSVPLTPASTETFGTGQLPSPGSGDACIHPNSATCPGGVIGFQGSYPYTVEHYTDGGGCDIVDFWLIHGLQHAHPDAPGDGPYADPLGPDITAASYAFFLSHPMPGARR